MAPGLRIRQAASHGVGEAGWGRTIFAAIISFIYFFPVLVDHPHRLQVDE